MLVTAWLTLIVALTISGTAIFYSVTGLTAIFAGAAVAIVIMGTTLEVAKLVAALWLHRHWHEAPRYIRAYLVFAVVVLMAITSLGIFGFLSKAHVEQTAASQNQVAQLERIEADIAGQERAIARARTRIDELRADAARSDDDSESRVADLRQQIAQARERERARISDARTTISEIESRVADKIAPYQEELDQFDAQVAQLDKVIQGLIDMDYLSRAQKRQEEQAEQRTELAQKRRDVLARIEEIRQEAAPRIDQARARIADIRSDADATVEDLRARIADLSAPQADAGSEESTDAIARQRELISQARDRIEDLSARKFDIETDLRALETKVGPIKYLAAFVAGEEADEKALETAVRWVILVIIAVFDPLAVLLLISSQWSFMQYRAQKTGAPHATPASDHAPAAHPTAGAARARPAAPRPTSGPAQPRVQAAQTGAQEVQTAPADPQPGGPHPAAPPATATTAEPAPDTPGDDPESIKQELRNRVQDGKRKPSPKARGTRERMLGEALYRFTDPQNPDFDRAFTQELRSSAPASWLAHRKG